MPLCPCCGINLSGRTIRRHLLIRQRALEAHLDAVNEAEAGPVPPDDDDLAPANNADPAFDDADMDFDLAGPAPRDNSPALSEDQPANWRRINIADLIAREVDDDDIGKYAHLLIVNS
jgi:hypothetical protein